MPKNVMHPTFLLEPNQQPLMIMRTTLVTILLACAMLAGLTWAAVATAADIELEVPRLEGEKQQQLQTRALQAAFTRAVYEEALGILPGELQPLRRELLYDFLSSRSAKFIQGYSDVAHEPVPGGVRIYAKVTVNRNDLKKLLQDMGILYTVDAFLPYTLALGQGAGSTGEEITRLQFLSGLSSIHGAQPKLTLERASQDIWTGHLKSDVGEWRSRSSDLETLWITLWGNYFSRTGLASKGKKALSVQVAGWKAPEDIHAFDEELKTWERMVSMAELVEVSLDVGGMTARWQILTDKTEAVKEALNAKLAGQGLTVLLQSPDAALADTLPGANPLPLTR